jgi:hypothetical protein
MLISAGRQLQEARERVEAGEAGNVTWPGWCKIFLPNKAESTIRLAISFVNGKTDEEAAVAVRQHRQKNAESNRKLRERKATPSRDSAPAAELAKLMVAQMTEAERIAFLIEQIKSLPDPLGDFMKCLARDLFNKDISDGLAGVVFCSTSEEIDRHRALTDQINAERAGKAIADTPPLGEQLIVEQQVQSNLAPEPTAPGDAVGEPLTVETPELHPVKPTIEERAPEPASDVPFLIDAYNALPLKTRAGAYWWIMGTTGARDPDADAPEREFILDTYRATPAAEQQKLRAYLAQLKTSPVQELAARKA